REGGELGVRLLRKGLDLLVEELLQPLLEGGRVAPGVAEDVRRLLVEEERIEEVLDRHVLVPAAGGLPLGDGEGDLDFVADAHGYSGSAVSRRGIPYFLSSATPARSARAAGATTSAIALATTRAVVAASSRPWAERLGNPVAGAVACSPGVAARA